MAHSAQQAQPVQPAQPAQPSQTSQSARQYLSSEEDIEHVREWLEEDGDDFGDHIQGFQNLARYKEAEKRTRQTETAALASDFPEDGAQQNQMARRLYRAFKTWRLGIPGCSFTNQAINKVAKQKKFMLELAAWQLLVRYSKPQNLVKADTN
jgi:acyl transferase domain-containing protein